MRRNLLLSLAFLGAVSCPIATAAGQTVLGGDAAACTGGGGPAVRVTVDGLKDRTGELKLELYPSTEDDFLKDDRDLIKEGKFFRRVRVTTPANGLAVLCIRAPRAGSYALLFTHNRDGRNKFNFWADGAGFPSNAKLGRARPSLAMARIAVPDGVTAVTIRAQYLRGFSGFAPLKDD